MKNFIGNQLSMSQRHELEKLTRELLRQGIDKELIPALLKEDNDFGKHILRIEDTLLASIVDEIFSNFDAYPFIKKVKSSKIISEQASGNLFLYDSVKKTKEQVCETNLMRNVKFDWKAKTTIAHFDYNPFLNKDIDTDSSGNTIFNTYIPPKWRENCHYNNIKVPDTEIPSCYTLFFNHLFENDQKSVNYVIQWLANMLQSRNQTYLATIGTMGAGKGILGDIIKGLVGEENYTRIKMESLKDRFNNLLMNKRAIYLDEAKITDSAHEDILKDLVNDSIEIEVKHQNKKTLKNYASIYISSNHLDALKINADDRRFSITELTETPFKERFPITFRTELLDADNICLLGQYLLNLTLDSDSMRQPFISNRTQLARKSALTQWQDHLLYTTAFEMAGHKIPMAELESKLRDDVGSNKFSITVKSLENLAKQYRGFYTVKRELTNSRKLYVVTFETLDKQPRHLLEDNCE